MLKLTKEQVQTLLRRASTPEHPDFRSIWNQLHKKSYKPLERQLSNKYSNICFEDIQELVSDAFIAFQMQLVRKNTSFHYKEKGLNNRQKFERIRERKRFVRLLQNEGYLKYLFKLCNWMSLDFLRIGRRQAINIVTIDAILLRANESELYQDFETAEVVADIELKLPVWWQRIENLLGPNLFPVFYDFTIEELSHQEIAKKYEISEISSRERKSRAERRLKTSNLMVQFKQYLSIKSVSIFFIIILF